MQVYLFDNYDGLMTVVSADTFAEAVEKLLDDDDIHWTEEEIKEITRIEVIE